MEYVGIPPLYPISACMSRMCGTVHLVFLASSESNYKGAGTKNIFTQRDENDATKKNVLDNLLQATDGSFELWEIQTDLIQLQANPGHLPAKHHLAVSSDRPP